MPRFHNLLLGALAAVVIAGFAFGLRRLFALRFEAGDDYADYSTLNTGPRGARALHDSLHQVGTPVVERNFLPLLRLKDRAGTTLVLAGAGATFFGDDSEKNFETFETFVREGLDVVVALNPRSIPSFTATSNATTDPWHDHPVRALPSKNKAHEPKELNAGERWGFAFQRAVISAKEPKDGFEAAAAVARDPRLLFQLLEALLPLESETTPTAAPDPPPVLPRWFSPWRWANRADEWSVLATVDGEPVIMRRSFGAGSLTLATDCTFLSNEALWRAPEPAFLLWFLGRQPRTVFDETLHGTQSDPGIMHLVRRYRLLGFFASVALLLALFVWRASSSLMPAHESIESARPAAIIGAEGAAGFTNLLEQSIPRKSLVRACFNEWAKSPLVRRRFSDETVAAVRDAVVRAESAGRRHCLSGYRAICQLLARSRGL